MSKKIHLTESQVEEIANKLNEIQSVPLQTSSWAGQPLPSVVQDVQKMQQAVPDKILTLNGVDMRKKVAPQAIADEIQNNAKQVSDGICEEAETEVYTKKQIKEAKLRYLKEHSTACGSKKDFKNRFIGK